MTDLLTLWQIAAVAKLGIRIKTDDPQLLRQQLYRVRADSGQFKDLGIILPSTPNQLWIVHQDADERRTYDKMHPQTVHKRPGVPQEEVPESGTELRNPEDIEELGEGE